MLRPIAASAWSTTMTATSAISASPSAIFVHPVRQRQGIGAEAVSAIGELSLHRVQAFIHPDNAPSRALAEKLGFRFEGLLRDNLRVGDEWRDDLLYALLANGHSNQA
jgi:[ribosomal protein S5]-alanine N-acetyltransferase